MPTQHPGKNGTWKDESGTWHLADYLGNPVFMRFDANGDGKLTNPEKTSETTEATYLLYTAGRDGDPATWEDNVASWK